MKGNVITYKVDKDTYFGVVLDKYKEYVSGCNSNQDKYIIRRLGSMKNGTQVICELGFIDNVLPRYFIQFIPMDL